MEDIDWQGAEYKEIGGRPQWQAGFRLICENYATVAAIPWPGKALDLGCGTGAIVNILKYFKNISEISGIDVNEQMLETAKKQNLDQRVTFYKGNVCEVESFPQATEGAFDLVTAVATIHWWPQPNLGIKNAFWALKPGGYFVANCWAGVHLFTETMNKALEMSPWIKEKHETVAQSISAKLAKMNEHLSWATPENIEQNLRQYLAGAGFNVLSLKPVRDVARFKQADGKAWWFYYVRTSTVGCFDSVSESEANHVCAEMARNLAQVNQGSTPDEIVFDTLVVEMLCQKPPVES